MAIFKDLATLEGHLEPFNHDASGIVYDFDDSTGNGISVRDIIEQLLLTSGGNSFLVPCSGTLVYGDVVYLNGSGQMEAARADDISTARAIGVAGEVDSAGFSCNVISFGPVSAYTGLSPGAKYFLSPTVAAGITSTIPTTPGHVVQFIGFAIDSNTLFVDTSKSPTIRS